MNKRRKKLLLIAPFAILGMLLFIYLGGQIVMRLWNVLLPSIFGLRQITFWEALGILVLCRILFGGFRIQNHTRSNIRRRMEERRALWEALTPEEKERIRSRMAGRCGIGPETGEGQSV